VTLSVVFDPTSSGASTGQLTIVSTSSTSPTTTVSVSGTGVSVTYGVKVSWTAPSSPSDPISGYNVYRAPSGSSTYQLMDSVGSSQLIYTDTDGILNGQTYDYIVESVDSSGNESVPSNMAAVTIPN
jgi:fibronectin type 3 domain-containing protein